MRWLRLSVRLWLAIGLRGDQRLPAQKPNSTNRLSPLPHFIEPLRYIRTTMTSAGLRRRGWKLSALSICRCRPNPLKAISNLTRLPTSRPYRRPRCMDQPQGANMPLDRPCGPPPAHCIATRWRDQEHSRQVDRFTINLVSRERLREAGPCPIDHSIKAPPPTISRRGQVGRFGHNGMGRVNHCARTLYPVRDR